MNRRDFIRHLAILAAGMSAMPAQVDAFEQMFELNAPRDTVGRGLLAVRHIIIGGMAKKSTPVTARFFRGQPEIHRTVACYGLNLFGGAVQWMTAPDEPIIAESIGGPFDFQWDVRGGDGELVDADVLVGCVRYIDQGGMWRMAPLTPKGGLHGVLLPVGPVSFCPKCDHREPTRQWSVQEIADFEARR
jgi:hypothetical protein